MSTMTFEEVSAIIRNTTPKEPNSFDWHSYLNADVDGCNIRISTKKIGLVCGSTITLSWK